MESSTHTDTEFTLWRKALLNQIALYPAVASLEQPTSRETEFTLIKKIVNNQALIIASGGNGGI